ncbi:hypothetical protein BD311DRAFT_684372 [Dichomitus squalens]|uniref:DUF6533 domain-containing protein n=1 Tax=Dichomitus squalens TaxID=114155 RepID=A0A4Q9N4Y8_9APHY|nr:hypothetical protein BD311DRAFT_684372 [Dichomitus squalens]
MSVDAGLNVAQFLATQQSIIIGHHCTLSALTLLLFDFAITLDREVELIWRRKTTGASVLFILTRYLSLAAYGVRSILMAHLSCGLFSYSALSILAQAVTYLQYLPWAAFSALRVFALSEEAYRWPTSIVVFVLSSLIFGMNFARLHWLAPVQNSAIGTSCAVFGAVMPSEINKVFSTVPRACLIAADVIVIFTTWHATYRTRATVRNAFAPISSRRTLSSILLRDGTLYFVVVLVMNIIYLVLTMQRSQVDVVTQVSYVVELTEPMTAILISRFILNLQEVDRRPLDISLSTTYTWSHAKSDDIVLTSRIVGSMGSSLLSLTVDEDERHGGVHDNSNHSL